MSVSLKRKGPKKGPMRDVPPRDFTHRGFGVVQVPYKEWNDRIAAIKVVRNLITSGRLPADAEPIQQSLSIVKGLFSRIHVGDCYDWYTTSRFLGHPSADLSKKLSIELAMLKGALREQRTDVYENASSTFTNEYGVEMLDNYLDMAEQHAHPVKEEGWAYVLWSSSERDVLHMGAAGGELEEVLERLNRENPGHHPYGVLAAWLVHDPVDAYNDIHEAFQNSALGEGFFRTDFGAARDTIAAKLKDTDNLAHSPWHDHDAPKTVAPNHGAKMVA